MIIMTKKIDIYKYIKKIIYYYIKDEIYKININKKKYLFSLYTIKQYSYYIISIYILLIKHL